MSVKSVTSELRPTLNSGPFSFKSSKLVEPQCPQLYNGTNSRVFLIELLSLKHRARMLRGTQGLSLGIYVTTQASNGIFRGFLRLCLVS